MKDLKELQKEIEKLKEELKDEMLENEEDIQKKADELLENFFNDNKKSIYKIFFKQLISNFFTLLLSFSVVYSFFVDSFALSNRWYILLIFVIISFVIVVERLICKKGDFQGFNYLFGVLGLLNISLFTLINYFTHFSSDIVLFNIVYIFGILFYTVFNFIMLRHQFRKVDV